VSEPDALDSDTAWGWTYTDAVDSAMRKRADHYKDPGVCFVLWHKVELVKPAGFTNALIRHIVKVGPA
jgi:hypothetical protein